MTQTKTRKRPAKDLIKQAKACPHCASTYLSMEMRTVIDAKRFCIQCLKCGFYESEATASAALKIWNSYTREALWLRWIAYRILHYIRLWQYRLMIYFPLPLTSG